METRRDYIPDTPPEPRPGERRRTGRPVGGGHRKLLDGARLTLLMPGEEYEALRRMAAAAGVSIAEVVRNCLRRQLPLDKE